MLKARANRDSSFTAEELEAQKEAKATWGIFRNDLKLGLKTAVLKQAKSEAKQQEADGKGDALDQLCSTIEYEYDNPATLMERLWSSQVETQIPGHDGRELCSFINEAIRNDGLLFEAVCQRHATCR